MELHHRVCNAWNTIEPGTVEWGDGGFDEPDVELDRLQCELLRRVFRDDVESALGDHNHKYDVFAFHSE